MAEDADESPADSDVSGSDSRSDDGDDADDTAGGSPDDAGETEADPGAGERADGDAESGDAGASEDGDGGSDEEADTGGGTDDTTSDGAPEEETEDDTTEDDGAGDDTTEDDGAGDDTTEDDGAGDDTTEDDTTEDNVAVDDATLDNAPDDGTAAGEATADTDDDVTDSGEADADADGVGAADGGRSHGKAIQPMDDSYGTSDETISGPGPPDSGTDDGSILDGPTTDEEMPLADHVEEMIRRLAVVVVLAAVATIVVFPFGEEIISFLWNSVLPGVEVSPHIYSPPELLITQLKVASLGGLVVALPVMVYESYLFMRPGLYPHERRYYLAAVPTSLVLAFVGLTFAYFVVLPAVFTYFLQYSEETANIAFGLAPTFNLILVLMGYLAVVFQIPLLVMLAMMMGLVTREWLVGRRLLFWGAFAGISFFFSPDPTGVSPLIIAVTMIALFEGTLFLSQWTKAGGRGAGD